MLSRAFLLALLVALAPTAAADPIAISPTGDADAQILAVSGTNDASSDGVAVSGTGTATSTCRAFGTIPCATITGTGSTSGSTNVVDAGRARVCHNNGFSRTMCLLNGEGDANHIVAVASGNASGIIAIARDGNARGGYLAISEGGDAHSYGATASLDGDAQNGWLSISGHGDANGAVAIAPHGRATGLVAIGGDNGLSCIVMCDE